MSYTHNKKTPIILKSDPIDPDGTDWIYFSYQDWLRDGESITAHAATATDGAIITDSTYLGTLDDSEGTEFTDVYGVQVKADADADYLLVTHRVSTETTGAVDLGRLNIDHTAKIPVKTL